MSSGEKWVWHAEVYAFRRVILGISEDVKTSPCDERGEWFDEGLVQAATRRYRDKIREPIERRRRIKGDADQREGRAIANAWAQERGHADILAWAEAEQISWSDAYRICAADILRNSSKIAPKRGEMTAAEMGVKAEEIIPHHLVAADDPRVQARLREMGAA